MAIIDVPIPQMGEGLQEVIIQKFLKQPGDFVKRDELLYNMETDKAVMEVESPHEGVLREWLGEEGAVMPIGAAIARMEVTEAETENDAALLPTHIFPASEQPVGQTVAELVIPPRTRAYCREKNILEEEMRKIPAVSGKLLPSDVDAYLAAQNADATQLPSPASSETILPYSERPLTQQQRTFIYRIKRSAQIVVPATAKRSIEWGILRQLAERLRGENPDLQPSSFQIFAYCVSQVIRAHPKFRSTLVGETVQREYEHVNLGIAVGLPHGELTIATVPDADTLDFAGFVRTAQANIQRAREGEDQASDTTQFLLTYMGPYELTDAIPVLVAPAVAVLFIGSTFEQGGQIVANLALTFDHRLIQGIEAAEFLRAIVQQCQRIGEALVTM